ncbi:glycosyl transferase [Janibacter hoylei PVAS-1]|uniref:Glycosyl transferase n=1 Tax=Janibacter hoylei PVAS-1 TaxID=1210046 RepID=K1DWH3_9MICO|nr:glycosyl transferase [Janibacter hoylei PVAS-1]
MIVTVVHGRHAHLREQRRILRDVSPGTPHIIVAMDDHAIDDVVAGQPSVTVIHVERDPRGLPLARARNIGVRAALRSGADLVILLDVDCVPGPRLVSSYEIAAEKVPQALLCGPVTYLDEGVRVPDDARRLDDLTDPPPRPAGTSARHDPARRLARALLVIELRGQSVHLGPAGRLCRGVRRLRGRGHRPRSGRPRARCRAGLGRRRPCLPPASPGVTAAGRASRRHRAQCIDLLATLARVAHVGVARRVREAGPHHPSSRQDRARRDGGRQRDPSLTESVTAAMVSA